MPRRPVRHPRKTGRPLLLNENVEEQLVLASRAGVPIGIAATAAGISEDTFNNWLNRGRSELAARQDGEPVNEDEQIFVDLLMKVQQARAEAATRNALLIQRVAQGGQVIEETKETQPDGTIRETVRRTPPDWRASAWYLERQARHHFGKDPVAVELTGKNGGALQVESVDAQQLADRVAANIAATVTAAIEAGPGNEDDVVDAELVEG